jgi:hypothetical protein
MFPFISLYTGPVSQDYSVVVTMGGLDGWEHMLYISMEWDRVLFL